MFWQTGRLRINTPVIRAPVQALDRFKINLRLNNHSGSGTIGGSGSLGGAANSGSSDKGGSGSSGGTGGRSARPGTIRIRFRFCFSLDIAFNFT